MASATSTRIPTPDRIGVLFNEYRVLYELAAFRMGSLDRRVPVAGATLTAFVGSIPLLPSEAALVVLVVVPLSVVWLLRTTIAHARSLEDLLRRIEEIESRINDLAGESLIGFQSTHPSRGRAVGGRIGTETISAVCMVAAALLGGVLYLTVASDGSALTPRALVPVLVSLVAGYLITCVLRWRRYRYRRSSG